MALHEAVERLPRSERLRSATPPVRHNPANLTLLVADPEPEAFAVLSELAAATREVDLVTCADGAEALFLAGSFSPDVVVLSAQLPVVGASDVVSKLRAHVDTPIYVGLGVGEAEAAGPVLAVGATGILNRPYERRDLEGLLEVQFARIRERIDQEAVLRLGPLVLDSPAFEIRRDGRALDLTLREFELLKFLMLHAERAVSQDQIRTDVWGARGEDVTGNTIAVHIGRLRVRLEGAAEIISIRGVGYRLSLVTSSGH
jgi:two-component system OmpR family response regulator